MKIFLVHIHYLEVMNAQNIKKADFDFKQKICKLKDGEECRPSRYGNEEEIGCLSKSQFVVGICKSRDTLFVKVLRVSNTLGIPLREKKKKY